MKNLRPLLIIAIVAAGAAIWLIAFLVERAYQFEADGSVNPNSSLIIGNLYMGGNVVKPPAGATAVLNLCEFQDPYDAEFHEWNPIRDAAPAPSLDWLGEQVAFVESHQQAGRTTFVHCFQGTSRSGMVVVAYLMKKHRWPRDQALAFVRTKRAQTRPNPAFMELLSEWETALKAP